jgi:hypothetical protein
MIFYCFLVVNDQLKFVPVSFSIRRNDAQRAPQGQFHAVGSAAAGGVKQAQLVALVVVVHLRADHFLVELFERFSPANVILGQEFLVVERYGKSLIRILNKNMFKISYVAFFIVKNHRYSWSVFENAAGAGV